MTWGEDGEGVVNMVVKASRDRHNKPLPPPSPPVPYSLPLNTYSNIYFSWSLGGTGKDKKILMIRMMIMMIIPVSFSSGLIRKADRHEDI